MFSLQISKFYSFVIIDQNTASLLLAVRTCGFHVLIQRDEAHIFMHHNNWTILKKLGYKFIQTRRTRHL